MSKLLLKWINSDVVLSREVTSLDNDFRDGYLLGELLYKYRQQADFPSFTTTGSSDAKISNFKRLEPTMRTLGVFFNSRVATEIMDGKPGAMKTLMYELKTSLDSFHRGVSGPREKKLVQVIAIEKPVYNKTMAATFDNAIRTSVTNGIGQQKVAKIEFASKTADFHVSMEQQHAEDVDVYVSDVQRAKQISQQRKLHEREFMKAWDEKNVNQWKKNLARGKARREKEKNDFMQRSQTVQAARTKHSHDHRDSALVGIGEFEVTLQRELLKNDNTEDLSTTGVSMFKTAGGQPGTGVPTLTYMNPETLQDGLIHTQKTLKERHDDMVIRQQLHTRRRKRYVREKEARQVKGISAGVEGDIADQLLSMNKSEDVERLARTRVLIHTDLMRENARNRSNKAASLTNDFAKKEVAWKQLQASREVQWVVKPRVAAQAERLSALQEAASAAASCDTLDFVAEIIDRVLNVSDWVICCRSVGSFKIVDDAPLPAALWTDAMSMFAEDTLPIPDALPLPEPCNVFEHLPFSLCDRPLCSDQRWLMSSPFTGSAIMSLDPGSGEDSVAAALSMRDASSFVATVALAELPGADVVIESKVPSFNNMDGPVPDPKDAKETKGKKGKEEPVVDETPTEPPIIGKRKTLVDNPAWLFNAPVKNILGGVLVECNIAAEPLPEFPPLNTAEGAAVENELDPPVPVPEVLRVALFGPSDSLREKMAKALCHKLAAAEIAVIKIHDLVKELSIVEIESPSAIMTKLSHEQSESLRMLVYTDISEGGLIEDSTYVQIAKVAIESLDPSSGYILEDFPSTSEQARLLLLALTGVDRGVRKPQPNDTSSEFLPVKDVEFSDYDASLAVFDAMILVDSVDIAEPVEYRVRCRRNLNDETIVVLSDDCSSVDFLSDQFCPDKPHELLSVSLQLAYEETKELMTFASDLKLLQCSSIPSHSEEIISEAADLLISLIPKAQKLTITEVTLDESTATDKVTDGDAASTGSAAEAPVDAEAIAAAEHLIEAPAEHDPDAQQVGATASELAIKHIEGTIHNHVAKALVGMWSAVEKQSKSESNAFFQTVRDLRYRMVQRRRCLSDVLIKSYNIRDTKQELWDAFLTGFNSYDDDFRFDNDLKAELHLRALELRSEFWAVAGKRKDEVEAIRVKVLADGAVAVGVHCIQGSAAALVQSEVNRFKIGMNILQDYLKSVAAYKFSHTVFNALEECAAPLEDMYDITASGASLGAAATGKDAKAKPKGKGDAKVLRNPIAPILFDKTALLTIPDSAPLEEKADETDKKGKAAAKGKGGKGVTDTSVVVSPLDAVEQSALALAQYYSQGKFTAARELYEGNECVVDLMENVIWYEAERLKFAVNNIKERVTEVVEWLAHYELEAGELATQFIHAKYLRELACSEAVVARVINAVEDFSPIREQWLLANDSFSVMSDKLVVPLPVVPPVPELSDFPPNRLNGEQIGVAEDALARLQLGGLVLLEDVETWLQKTGLQGAPLGNTFTNGLTNITNLSLPPDVLQNMNLISSALNKEMMETQYLDSGVCPAFIVLKVLSELVVVSPPEEPAPAEPVSELEIDRSQEVEAEAAMHYHSQENPAVAPVEVK